jgi:hypothetical protein
MPKSVDIFGGVCPIQGKPIKKYLYKPGYPIKIGKLRILTIQ